MLNRKFTDNLATLAEAVLLTALFILMYLTVDPRYALLVFICTTILIFIYFTARSRLRVRNAVRRMTDEIAALPEHLGEKDYDCSNSDTRIFFEELARVKSLLDKRSRNRQELLAIVDSVASNMEFGALLRDLLPRFNDATRSSCSAFYQVNRSTNKLEIKHSTGFSKNIYSEFDLTLGEGLIGSAAVSKEISLIKDIPDDTVYFIRTFLGKIKPRSLFAVPIHTREMLTGILVCASIYDYTREDREMIELIKYYLGVAVNNGEHFERTKRLTSELTFQNKLIQDQHEEMKKRLNDKIQLLNCVINTQGEDCRFVLDDQDNVLIWSQNAERTFGVGSPSAMGKPIHRLIQEGGWPSLSSPLMKAAQTGFYTECFWRTGPDDIVQRYEFTVTRMQGDPDEFMGMLCILREMIA